MVFIQVLFPPPAPSLPSRWGESFSCVSSAWVARLPCLVLNREYKSNCASLHLYQDSRLLHVTEPQEWTLCIGTLCGSPQLPSDTRGSKLYNQDVLGSLWTLPTFKKPSPWHAALLLLSLLIAGHLRSRFLRSDSLPAARLLAYIQNTLINCHWWVQSPLSIHSRTYLASIGQK